MSTDATSAGNPVSSTGTTEKPTPTPAGSKGKERAQAERVEGKDEHIYIDEDEDEDEDEEEDEEDDEMDEDDDEDDAEDEAPSDVEILDRHTRRGKKVNYASKEAFAKAGLDPEESHSEEEG